MKYKNSTLNSIRADILMDTKNFLQCLESNASVEELSAILAQIKEKETHLIKKEGSTARSIDHSSIQQNFSRLDFFQGIFFAAQQILSYCNSGK